MESFAVMIGGSFQIVLVILIIIGFLALFIFTTILKAIKHLFVEVKNVRFIKSVRRSSENRTTDNCNSTGRK